MNQYNVHQPLSPSPVNIGRPLPPLPIYPNRPLPPTPVSYKWVIILAIVGVIALIAGVTVTIVYTKKDD